MVSKQEAYTTLGLEPGALPKEIEKKYKELALEWHPQKHKYSALSNQKFKEISKAYVTLSKPKEKKQDDMSMTEMLDLFEKAFFGANKVLLPDDLDNSDDYIDIDEGDDYSDSDCCSDIPDVFDNISGIVGVLEAEAKSNAQKAKKNAEELIAEEEKEKRKAAKRKAKKKRRKLKKQMEKDSTQQKHKTEGEASVSPARFQDSNASASEVEEEGLDPNSAFVAVAVSKSKVAAQLQQKKENNSLPATLSNDRNVMVQNVHPQVLQSRELAIRGNMMANIGEFQSAIGLFTDAIKLDPTEFKYFCNRSYCFHQLALFDRALKDADKAIDLQPSWPKGYFRKGQAQAGIQRYVEAEDSFRKVLSLDKSCDEALQELKRSQICQLMERGFGQQQAEQALNDHVNLQEARQALQSGAYPILPTTNGHNNNNNDHLQQSMVEVDDDEIYMSDEEDRMPLRPANMCQMIASNTGVRGASAPQQPLRTIAHLPAPTRAQIAAANKAGLSDFKMDSRNPEGRTSLWVGNVKAQVTEKILMNLFGKYGDVSSIRLLPDRRCAFINYKDRAAAGKAMNSLQGYECCGENLLIKFPDNTHAFGQAYVLKKKGTTSGVPASASEKMEAKDKVKGPVAGDECFFWRTTGCHYGNNCHYRHVKENKGVDNKFK